MERKVEKTGNGKKDGLNRCPYCGSTDVELNMKTGKLHCNFCRMKFDAQVVNAIEDISKLSGETVGSGAADVVPDAKVILTFQCSACGSSIVVDTDEAVNARCHWCRHVLSVNEQVPNGAVPDMVLPFRMEKGVAEGNIREFVQKRQFFAHPTFKKEFTTENVMGVYLPYMVVDLNGHAELKGQAEHKTGSYIVNKTRYYNADLYDVEREFDILIDDLTIESSSGKLDQNVLVNTNNVINAIMPFDVENAVAWDANYLRGFASEKRDTNIDDLRSQLELQAKDVARYKARETMEFYDRGARWDSETLQIKGAKWKSAYLPVWLYSYMQDDGKKKMLHYCAVNARTGETMGSVPINKRRLLSVSFVVELLGIILGAAWIFGWMHVDMDDNPMFYGLAGLTPGFIFYWWKMNRYRNMSARHLHERETRAAAQNMRAVDNKVKSLKGLRSPQIEGCNSEEVRGVVAKGGVKMMGEQMAGALGIGKMISGFGPKE